MSPMMVKQLRSLGTMENRMKTDPNGSKSRSPLSPPRLFPVERKALGSKKISLKTMISIDDDRLRLKSKSARPLKDPVSVKTFESSKTGSKRIKSSMKVMPKKTSTPISIKHEEY
ncbi:hypothetical protein SSS_04579 [Sarcoptes scabiei]|uniref:Uncharacterized protein n=1 Tax=Sarcoptes scabiei TaxID=52283 RepID=A0A834REE4_SARSC|nr:hypothetical protein SSS_04579 [Sarcoptes scabiei]